MENSLKWEFPETDFFPLSLSFTTLGLKDVLLYRFSYKTFNSCNKMIIPGKHYKILEILFHVSKKENNLHTFLPFIYYWRNLREMC